MKIKKRILIFLLAMAGLPTYADKAVPNPNITPLPPGFFNQFSPELYEVRINEHVLRIPTNHLKGRPIEIEKNFVALHARWPGMKPFLLSDNAPAPYDDIEILLDGVTFGRSSGKPSDGHGRARSEKGLLPPVMNKELGLWEYRLANPTPRPWHYVADVTRVGLDGKKYAESCMIICAGIRTEGNNDTLQCTVYYFVRGNVHVTYRFFHKHIADWHAMDREVRKLVESTFVKHNATGK